MPIKLIKTSFTAGELSPTLFGRPDLAKYANGAKRLLNMFPLVHGGVTNRPGLEFVGEVKNSAVRHRLIPFTFNTEQTYVLEFGEKTMRVIRDGGYVVYQSGANSGKIVEIVTPYASAHLNSLKFVQSADVMTLTHQFYPIYQLGRYAHDDWRISVLSFAPSIYPPASVSEPVVVQETSYEVPRIDRIGYAVTAVLEISGEESEHRESPVVIKPDDAHMKITWPAVAGAKFYNIYKLRNGLYGYIGQADTTEFIDTQQIIAALSNTPPRHQTLFNTPGNYPACSGYHQQRQWFGGTINNPQTFWASRTGIYRSMSVSAPMKADDAITGTLSSGTLDQIRDIAVGQDLLFFTSGNVWMISGDQNGAIKPSTINANVQNKRGISNVPPVMIGNTLLFVQERGSIVRGIGYDQSSESYNDVDYSIMAQHLLRRNEISEWAYASIPNSIIWCITTDGKLLSMTYLREHEIWAWAQHETDGVFEGVCSVAEDEEDAVYVIVRRTINGQTKRYVERMASRDVLDVKDAFFVDSGLTYRGTPTTTLSGLDHLEGKTVHILADGSVSPPCVVTGGKVSVEIPASIIHVGLPYLSEVETLEPELQKQSIFGMSKSVPEVTFRLYESRGGWIGPSRQSMIEFKQRDKEYMGDPIVIYSRDIRVSMPPGWDPGGSIVVQQRDPLPITITAVMFALDVGGA